jgi:hypothetical protein
VESCQLNDLTLPVDAVKYWRQSIGAKWENKNNKWSKIYLYEPIKRREINTKISSTTRKHGDFDVPSASGCCASCKIEHQLDIARGNG